MMNLKEKKNILNNERGNLAIDFIFGMTLTFASMAIFFALSFSLSVTEIAQYVAFATARTYTAAHKDEATQQERANLKYQQLINTGVFKTLLKESDWFKLHPPVINSSNDQETYFPVSDARDIFVGPKFKFEANMLDMNLPLLGSSSEQGGFVANINAFIGREPSFSECMVYQISKKQMMESLGYSFPGDLVVMVDNGC